MYSFHPTLDKDIETVFVYGPRQLLGNRFWLHSRCKKVLAF